MLAAAIAAYVLWSGTSLIGSSVSGLMDAAPPPDVVDRIRRLVAEHAEGALEVHDLRTRHAGRLTYLEFHLVVPGDMRVSEAHGICDRIEAALRGEMQHLTTTIHVEPEGKAKHHGVLVGCDDPPSTGSSPAAATPAKPRSATAAACPRTPCASKHTARSTRPMPPSACSASTPAPRRTRCWRGSRTTCLTSAPTSAFPARPAIACA